MYKTRFCKLHKTSKDIKIKSQVELIQTWILENSCEIIEQAFSKEESTIIQVSICHQSRSTKERKGQWSSGGGNWKVIIVSNMKSICFWGLEQT